MRIKLTNNIIACTAILCILFSIWSNYIVYKSTSFTGMDVSTGEGRVSLCVNAPPTLSISCSSSATVGSAYNCDIDATDLNSGQAHTFGDNTSLFDINSATGVISFTPTSEQLGSYSINISVNDSSGCVNNFGSSVFSLTISTAAAPPTEEAPKAAAAAGGGGGGGACSSAWECGDWGSCTDNIAARICKDTICGKPNKTESTTCGFIASPMIMRVLIKTGEKLIEQLKITNTGNTPLNIIIEKKNLDFVSFSQDNFRLEAGEEKAINVVFDTKTLQPDVYVGKIIIKGDNVEEGITTIVEVESRLVLFDVSLDIPARYRKIYPGDEILAQITLINLANIGLTNVSMVYYVKDLEGNLILSEEETIAVETEASYEKRFLIPKGTKLGDYVLIVQTRYKDSFGMASELFEIVSPVKPAPPRDYIMWLLLIIGLLLAIFALLVYERLRLKEKGRGKKEDRREIKLEKERIAKEKLELLLERKDRLRKEKLEAKLRKKEEEEKKKERIRQEIEEKIRKAAELRKQLEEQRKNERIKRIGEKKKEAEENRRERLARKRLAKAKRRKAILAILHSLGLRKTREELEEIRQRKLKREEERRKAGEEKRARAEEEKRRRLEEEKRRLNERKKAEEEEEAKRLAKEKRREEERRKAEEERKEREAEIKKERQEEKAKIEERIREREERLKEIQLERERLKMEKLRVIQEAREKERLKSEEERRELKEEFEKKRKLREEKIREELELRNKLREQKIAEKLKIKEEKERRRKEAGQLREKKLRERARLEKELEKRKEILEEKRKAEEEAKRLAEEKREIEEEKKAEEERRRLEREEEERRLEEEKRKLDERKKAEEEERRKRLEKEYKKRKERLLKQLNMLEEGYKSEFISEESYNKDKEKITNELDKIEARITNE